MALSNLNLGTVYEVFVVAFDPYGSGGRRTNFNLFTTQTNRAPTAPGNIIASAGTPTSAAVSWAAASDPDGDAITYEVEIKPGGTFVWGSPVSSTSTSLDYNNLTPNTVYDVRVRAQDNWNPPLYGAYREQIDVITTPPPSANRAPTTPGNLVASAVTPTSATVSWGASSDPDSDAIAYEVEIKVDGVVLWDSQVSTTSTSLNYTNLNPNTIYDVRVRARDNQTPPLYSAYREQENVITTPPANPAAAQVNVVRPGDPIILVNGVNDGDGNSGAPPPAEGVEHAIDGVTQKYLNFLDLGSGFIVTPSAGSTIVKGLRFYTANDAMERDPASYLLEGSTSGTNGPWTTISSGGLDLPLGRNPGGLVPINPLVHSNQVVNFPNTSAFTTYRVTFPTLRNAAAANSMQIAEVELLATPILLSVARQGSGVIINGTATDPGNLVLEASTNLAIWTRRASLTADINGAFQFLEPDLTAPPHRFYRLLLESSGQFPSGLVTWWRGENDYRDSFGTNHGSAFSNAGPTFVAGQRGLALSFNGTTEGMFIGGAPIPSPWTASFWVKRDDATEASAALLTSVAGGLKLEQWNFTRQVGFTAFGVADYSFAYSLPTNEWTHLTFVSAPQGTILYTNATAVATNAATISLPLNVLGVRQTGQDHLQGQLDEITLFNRALSAAEIQQVINATRPQFPAGLVTWWRGENDYRDSFGTNHGSVFSNAGPTFVAGQRGQALSFNGTTEGMFIGGAPIPSPWTASFWIKREDATEASAALLTSVAGGLKLEQWNFTRQVGFTAFGVADYSFNYSVPTNEWTHLTFVSGPGATILYTNGTAVATNAATISLPLNILGVRETGQDHMKGQLDEITLFNRALSPAEIQQVINETRGN